MASTRPISSASAASERLWIAAQNLFGDQQSIFVEHPPHEINQPPAHDVVDRGDRPCLNHGDERAPLFVVEQGRTSGRFAIDEAVRPLGVEAKHPIAERLQANPSEPSRVRPHAAFINRDQREKAPRDAAGFLRKRQSAKHRPSKSTRNEIGAAMSNSPRRL